MAFNYPARKFRFLSLILAGVLVWNFDVEAAKNCASTLAKVALGRLQEKAEISDIDKMAKATMSYLAGSTGLPASGLRPSAGSRR